MFFIPDYKNNREAFSLWSNLILLNTVKYVIKIPKSEKYGMTLIVSTCQIYKMYLKSIKNNKEN